MKHKNELRKKVEMHAREYACAAVAIMAVTVVAGLFSSCSAMRMGGRNLEKEWNQEYRKDEETPVPTPTPFLTSTPGGKPVNTPLSTVEAPSVLPSSSPEAKPVAVPTPTPNETSAPSPGEALTPTPTAVITPIPSTPETSAAPSTTPVPPATSAAPTPTPNSNKAIVNPYVAYTWDQMMEEAAALEEAYGDILELDSAGLSVEGRDLLLIRLGKGDKKIFLCGTHHAREYITSSYLMKMTEEYARSYTESSKFAGYNVRALLEKVTLYIVPMVNPDGVNLVNNGIKAVSNQDTVAAMAMVKKTYREWKANINGVDLNRQYPAEWDEKYDNVGKPASENYKGTDSATEPEVKAMMELCESNDFILAASFHTKGNTIFWADSGTVKSIPGAQDMVKRLESLTKYTIEPVSQKPSVYGAGFENWFRLRFSRPGLCIELTPMNNTDVPHNDLKFDSLVWSKAKAVGLFLADEADKRK